MKEQYLTFILPHLTAKMFKLYKKPYAISGNICYESWVYFGGRHAVNKQPSISGSRYGYLYCVCVFGGRSLDTFTYLLCMPNISLSSSIAQLIGRIFGVRLKKMYLWVNAFWDRNTNLISNLRSRSLMDQHIR